MTDALGGSDGMPELELPFHIADATSWRMVAELVRRHPDELWVLRTFPFEGHYDCLTVVRRSRPLDWPAIRFNRHGCHADFGWFGPGEAPAAPAQGSLIRWTDYLYAEDPRDWLAELEARVGLPKPRRRQLPPSTPASLTVRWIAQFLSAQIGARPRWTAWTVIDAAASRFAYSFDALPGPAQWVEEQGDDLAAVHGVWFLGTHDGAPHLALSWAGDLWTANGARWLLPAERRPGESITSLVARTAGPHLP